MQKLGQHFLRNEKINEAIISALDVQHGERVIEIGPGHGELTVPLLQTVEKLDGEAAPKSGSTIISIEKDHALIASLEGLAKKERAGRLSIIEGDALKLLSGIVREFRTATYKVAGNIPYYITGKLLRVLSELEHKPARAVLMIQKEVAERICAAPPGMNRLAASVQFWADATIVAHVPRKDFSPPPEVDSAVIALVAKNPVAINPAQYYKTVRGIFSQPRKTLLNNIAAMGGNLGGQKEKITLHLKKLGIDPGARPQDLSIEEIIAVADAALWG